MYETLSYDIISWVLGHGEGNSTISDANQQGAAQMNDTPVTDAFERPITKVFDRQKIGRPQYWVDLARDLERHANAMADALRLLEKCGHPCGTSLAAWIDFVNENSE